MSLHGGPIAGNLAIPGAILKKTDRGLTLPTSGELRRTGYADGKNLRKDILLFQGIVQQQALVAVRKMQVEMDLCTICYIEVKIAKPMLRTEP
jgi:hypothetical protein